MFHVEHRRSFSEYRKKIKFFVNEDKSEKFSTDLSRNNTIKQEDQKQPELLHYLRNPDKKVKP